MELHQLRYFVAVAELGHFTKAAERCFVSQPSLSQQILKLERELKHPLFDRTGRRAALTEAGRALYDSAKAVLAALDDAEARVRTLGDDGGGVVHVGAIPTIAPYLFPPLLKRFAADHPKAEVTLHEDLTARTLEACLTGDLDLAVVALPVDDGRLHAEPLFRDELLAALPPGHALAKKKQLSLADLAGEPFVLLSDTHCLGEQVYSLCRQPDFHPPVRCASAQILTVQELVALGHGVSLVPRLAADQDRAGLCVYRPLAGEPPTRTLALVWRKDRYQGRVVRQLIDELRDDAARRAAPPADPPRH
jgi:LysR family transcriptional regulator, hydrogen peroxide-inducible genes activator